MVVPDDGHERRKISEHRLIGDQRQDKADPRRDVRIAVLVHPAGASRRLVPYLSTNQPSFHQGQLSCDLGQVGEHLVLVALWAESS